MPIETLSRREFLAPTQMAARDAIKCLGLNGLDPEKKRLFSLTRALLVARTGTAPRTEQTDRTINIASEKVDTTMTRILENLFLAESIYSTAKMPTLSQVIDALRTFQDLVRHKPYVRSRGVTIPTSMIDTAQEEIDRLVGNQSDEPRMFDLRGALLKEMMIADNNPVLQ